jgi:CBS-domain-containing membrane protein
MLIKYIYRGQGLWSKFLEKGLTMKLTPYIAKMRGGEKSPPFVGLIELWWSWLGSFCGIFACAFLSFHYQVPLLIGSFGASAVLIYAAIDSPLAQPRNLVGGHIVSAIIGVTCFKLLGMTDFACAMAVSLAIVGMLLTKTLHPPGGATALIAVITPSIYHLGYYYVVTPVGIGALIMLLVALLTNNPANTRRYPRYWF